MAQHDIEKKALEEALKKSRRLEIQRKLRQNEGTSRGGSRKKKEKGEEDKRQIKMIEG